MAKRKTRICKGNDYIKCSRTGVSSNVNYRCKVCLAINKQGDIVGKFKNSNIIKSIWAACESAGTVQTYRDIRDINTHFNMLAKSNRYGLVDGKRLNVSHLVATGGSNKVGLTTNQNLVMLSEGKNKSLGNKEVFQVGVKGIHYLDNCELVDRWRVGKLSQAEFIELLESYIGYDKLYEWAESVNVRAKKRTGKPYKHSSGASLFQVMNKQLVGYGSWLDSVEILAYEQALVRYKELFCRVYKVEVVIKNDVDTTLYWNYSEDVEIGLLLQEALYTGDDSYLTKATQVIELATSKVE